MENPAKIDALILIHPGIVASGADLKMRIWWQMIDAWQGPVYIVDSPIAPESSSHAANTLRAIINARIDDHESRGKKCRWIADGEKDLIASVNDISRSLSSGAHIDVTGAFADGAVQDAAWQLRDAGFGVSIDDSALWPDEVDTARDARAAARHKALKQGRRH